MTLFYSVIFRLSNWKLYSTNYNKFRQNKTDFNFFHPLLYLNFRVSLVSLNQKEEQANDEKTSRSPCYKRNGYWCIR